jgi:hypothetical protein
MYSPWGKVQDKRVHQRGVTWVSTPGHGGLMVSKGFAHKFLSEAARKRAILWNNAYYCFEEDCDCCIVFNELIYLETEEQKKANFLNLSRWNPDYLLEVGIDPEPERYSEWKKSKAEDTRRASKDPNMVVAGVQLDSNIGQVKAWTADGSEYTVTQTSYRRVMFESRTCNLSDMELVR